MNDARPKPAPVSATPMKVEVVADEKYKYNALAPVGSVGTLKALLEGQKGALLALLPKHVTPERLFRMLLVAVNRSPDLLECTQTSIVESVGRAAELGLDISGTLQEAWIIPFNNKIKDASGREIWAKQATLMPGYRGLAKLARQSGEVASLQAHVVKEHDDFELVYGTGDAPRLRFAPLLRGPRGATVSVYAHIKLISGEDLIDWMSVEDVEKVRAKSKQPNSLMWKDHWDEGARKTVFRRLAKWAPLSAEKANKFHEAVAAADVEFDIDKMASAIQVPEEQTSLPPRLSELSAEAAPAPAAAGEAAGQTNEPAPTDDGQQALLPDAAPEPSAPTEEYVKEAIAPADKKKPWKIVFTSSGTLSTFDEKVVRVAEAAVDRGVPVRLTTLKSGKFTNIATLVLAEPS